MLTKELRLLGFLLIALVLVPSALSRCNTCNDNGAACLDATRFQLCFNNVIDKSQIFNCPDGSVCSSSKQICEPNAVPACAAGVISCGKCDGSNMFTCTSRTTYAQCNGNELLPDNTASCQSGFECDSMQEEICMPAGSLPFGPQCNN